MCSPSWESLFPIDFSVPQGGCLKEQISLSVYKFCEFKRTHLTPLRQASGQETQYNYMARAQYLMVICSISRDRCGTRWNKVWLCSNSPFVSWDFEVMLLTELQHLPFPLRFLLMLLKMTLFRFVSPQIDKS